MSTQVCLPRPTRAAVLGFMSLLGIAVALALAKGERLIDAGAAARAIGFTIGVMIVVVGNFLPKMRPLESNAGDSAMATSAERFAGWLLVLAGLAYTGLFAFAPLAEARPISSIIGIGTLLVIAVNWAWLKRGALFNSKIAEECSTLREPAPERRKIAIWLMFALAFVLVSACGKFLFNDNRWANEVGSWLVLVFGMTYAVLYAVLESRRSPS
ncbi:MAG TPA: hypothetical protein VEJ86_00310 [Candidatus Binataceae bacterium]|nr:hypothetical protein [Candidatus Binataceae bacterium]